MYSVLCLWINSVQCLQVLKTKHKISAPTLTRSLLYPIVSTFLVVNFYRYFLIFVWYNYNNNEIFLIILGKEDMPTWYSMRQNVSKVWQILTNMIFTIPIIRIEQAFGVTGNIFKEKSLFILGNINVYMNFVEWIVHKVVHLHANISFFNF